MGAGNCSHFCTRGFGNALTLSPRCAILFKQAAIYILGDKPFLDSYAKSIRCSACNTLLSINLQIKSKKIGKEENDGKQTKFMFPADSYAPRGAW